MYLRGVAVNMSGCDCEVLFFSGSTFSDPPFGGEGEIRGR